ncbi:MAG: hypothetical protein HY805_08415 [Nitrospirae bacterium]|nr:hypothetical protein [Nitrospirota bacterium]
MKLKTPSSEGYGIVETFIVLIIIGVLAITFMERFERTAIEAKKEALRIELINLRQSILLFKIIKGRYPNDLKELISEEYALPHKVGEDETQRYVGKPIFRRKYIEPYSVDERMNILDPFGLAYLYYPANGSVRSQKDGFEYY